MTEPKRSVIKERELAHAPEKVWRALTQEHLISDWLMDNDFKPEVGHQFELRAAWGSVNCKVLVVEPFETLSFTWVALGLESIVTWTLIETDFGTRLRMEQAGFAKGQGQAYSGAKQAWEVFLDQLGNVIENLVE